MWDVVGPSVLCEAIGAPMREKVYSTSGRIVDAITEPGGSWASSRLGSEEWMRGPHNEVSMPIGLPPH